MKTVVITQSNYIPWRGYFAMIAKADELILLESVQYTRRDWRNRNLIKTPTGTQWLTIPVDVKGKYLQAIDETRIADSMWAEKHIRSIETNYRRAKHFDEIAPWMFEALRAAEAFSLLTESNHYLIHTICHRLGLRRPIRRCTEILPRAEMINMESSDRLLALCLSAGATRYLSGPSAKNYLNLEKFERAGIEVDWMDYDGLPEYDQSWGTFTPYVSIVDLLLNCGQLATKFVCDMD